MARGEEPFVAKMRPAVSRALKIPRASGWSWRCPDRRRARAIRPGPWPWMTNSVPVPSTGADCHSTLGCVRALGIEVEGSGTEFVIHGRGLDGLRAPSADLDAGNSGSTIRMLSGILAAQPFTSRIFGDESLSRRPMQRIIQPLAEMGAHIRAREGRFPPLEIHGGPLTRHRLRAAGGQRPGEDVRAAGRAVRGGRNDRTRAGADARSHRNRRCGSSARRSRLRRTIAVRAGRSSKRGSCSCLATFPPRPFSWRRRC